MVHPGREPPFCCLARRKSSGRWTGPRRVGLPDDYDERGHGFANMRADAERLGGTPCRRAQGSGRGREGDLFGAIGSWGKGGIGCQTSLVA